MDREIEVVVRVVRPHGLDEKPSLIDLFQISGIVGRKEWLTLRSVGYRKLLTRQKMWVNGGKLDRCFLLLIGKIILTRVMVRCAVMLKILCLGNRIRRDWRHHFHVKRLRLLLLRMVEMILTVLVYWGGLGRNDRQVRVLMRKRRVQKWLLDVTRLWMVEMQGIGHGHGCHCRVP